MMKKPVNKLQQKHLTGKIDLYKPVEAYYEEGVHEVDANGDFVKAYPKPDTRKRADLPPIATQWQQDYRNRFCKDKQNGKSSSSK